MLRVRGHRPRGGLVIPDRAHIELTKSTRERLREHKRDGETWDDCLRRLADGNPSIRVVVDRQDETTEYDVGAEGLDIVSDGPVGVRVSVEFD